MFKHLVNKPSAEKVTKIIQNAVAIEQVGSTSWSHWSLVSLVSLVPGLTSPWSHWSH